MADLEKKRIQLQFHITGRCNLRCKHCYRTEGDVERLSFNDVINVFEQFKALRLEFNRIHKTDRKGHINLTGGEPFLREDIRDILAYLGENNDVFSYGVLSNGSFIDDGMISLLKSTEAAFVQLSIDGDRVTHDALRAQGDYDRVMKTAEFLEKSGVRVYISFTANSENYSNLSHVASECRKRGITKLWTDRLVPIGNGAELEGLVITDKLIKNYLGALKAAQGGRIKRMLCKKTAVTANRALQFIGADGDIYNCNAGKGLITVTELGEIMPCRRMPIACGSVFDSSLCDVYFRNDIFRLLRLDAIPYECEGCAYAERCRGGAKCQSYANYGSFFYADPACPLRCSDKKT